MTHTQAVQLQAVEKYLLNELTQEQADTFEEHYFDCAECAEAVKASVRFIDTSRQLFREGEFEPKRLAHG